DLRVLDAQDEQRQPGEQEEEPEDRGSDGDQDLKAVLAKSTNANGKHRREADGSLDEQSADWALPTAAPAAHGRKDNVVPAHLGVQARTGEDGAVDTSQRRNHDQDAESNGSEVPKSGPRHGSCWEVDVAGAVEAEREQNSAVNQ